MVTITKTGGENEYGKKEWRDGRSAIFSTCNCTCCTRTTRIRSFGSICTGNEPSRIISLRYQRLPIRRLIRWYLPTPLAHLATLCSFRDSSLNFLKTHIDWTLLIKTCYPPFASVWKEGKENSFPHEFASDIVKYDCKLVREFELKFRKPRVSYSSIHV